MTDHKEYPITAPPTSNWVQCRIDMLSFLTDQVIAQTKIPFLLFIILNYIKNIKAVLFSI